MCKGKTKAQHHLTMLIVKEIISLSDDRTTLTVKGYPYGAPDGFSAIYNLSMAFWTDEDITDIRKRFNL